LRVVSAGGGVSVIRQNLIPCQIDEKHLAVSPIPLGEGEKSILRNQPPPTRIHRRPNRPRRKCNPRFYQEEITVLEIKPANVWGGHSCPPLLTLVLLKAPQTLLSRTDVITP
jgi:hypothetical protein